MDKRADPVPDTQTAGVDDLSYLPSLSRRVARLRREGHSPKAVRYARPFHGLRRPADVDLDQPGLRVADAIGLMTSGCVLTGWASRWLQRQRYCDGTRYGEDLPVTILCGPGSDLRSRRGIRPSDRRYLPGEVVDLGELDVATLARATYDDMLDAPNPVEALVAVEMATSTVIQQARASMDNVRAVYGSHVKTRGRRQARWALDNATTRSGSPWETRTRVLANEAIGLDRWSVNVPVFDLNERLLGVPDLLDPDTGLVIESDGGDHRKIAVHNNDNVREEAFEDHGMTVVRIGSAQHARTERPATIDRIRSGHDRAYESNRRLWTTDKPDWWWDWPPGRRWD